MVKMNCQAEHLGQRPCRSKVTYTAERLHYTLTTKWSIIRNLNRRRQTRTTRCLTPVVLYTKVDVQCDKLVTDDRRQFITLSVHIS